MIQEKKHRRKKNKKPSAMAQVHNKVNAGVMDGVVYGGMMESVNESPDTITNYDIDCYYRDDDAWTFLFLNKNNSFYVADRPGMTHYEIMDELIENEEIEDFPFKDEDFNEVFNPQLTGRYWAEGNIISFWRTPLRNRSDMREAVRMLSEEISIEPSTLVVDVWDLDSGRDLFVPYVWFFNGWYDTLIESVEDIYAKPNIKMVVLKTRRGDMYVSFDGKSGILDYGQYCDYMSQNQAVATMSEGAEPEMDEFKIGPEKKNGKTSVSPYYHVTNEGKKTLHITESQFRQLKTLIKEEKNKVNEAYDKYVKSFINFLHEQHLRIDPLPDIEFNDEQQEGLFIRTGYYSPDEKKIVVFTCNRALKDIMRTVAHEFVHHMQNLENPEKDWGAAGDLEADSKLRAIEGEAFLLGNILFREWTEKLKKTKELNESKKRKKQVKNDEGELVPEKCDKCGGEVVCQIHGEPVYVCKDCGKYFGTMPFNLNERIDIRKALKRLKKRRDPANIENWKPIDEEVDKLAKYRVIYAKGTYGTTNNFDAAGFILIDGELLDFGDYESIQRASHGALDVAGANKREFMADGNIRVNPESPGIELCVEPTNEQYNRIAEALKHWENRGIFYVDCVTDAGSNIWNKSYEGEEFENVITDIRDYFGEGKNPGENERGNEVLAGYNLRDFLEETTDEMVEPDDVDLSSFNIKKHLNPKFWDNGHLDTRIRLKLLDIADDFFESLDVDWVEPEDVIMTGSLANYNWNQKYSDIDLHILVDYEDVDERTDFVKEYFDMKKNQWNQKHAGLKIFGFPVEVYVQDVNEPHASSGVYSVDKDKWLTEPDLETLRSGKVNKRHVRETISTYMNKIDCLIDIYKAHKDDKHEMEKVAKDAEEMLDEIKTMRRADLKKYNREMCDGNIIFKALRRTDYIGKLIKLKDLAYDKMNSI